jgi:hypothetical protein
MPAAPEAAAQYDRVASMGDMSTGTAGNGQDSRLANLQRPGLAMTSNVEEEAPVARRRRLDDDICVHIFTASATMVGVCLTVIGILRVVISLRREDTLADDMLAVNSLLYLASCLLSYWALRTRSVSRNYRLERIADVIFLIAMVFTAINAGFITWAISVG